MRLAAVGATHGHAYVAELVHPLLRRRVYRRKNDSGLSVATAHLQTRDQRQLCWQVKKDKRTDSVDEEEESSGVHARPRMPMASS